MVERPLDPGLSFDSVCRCATRQSDAALVLDGRGFPGEGWGPLAAWRPRVGEGPGPGLRHLEGRLAERRARGGTSATGVALLLPYAFPVPDRAWNPSPRGRHRALSVEVDAAVAVDGDATFVVARDGDAASGIEEAVSRAAEPLDPHESPLRGSARTSLPREAYVRAVDAVRRHIRRGDIYQANLTQRFELEWEGAPGALFEELRRVSPAPRAAYVGWGDRAVVSLSPETFVSVDRDLRIETIPIKGTRRRATPGESDERAARELLESAKDRAELVMIVDLERNDLGRVCEPGSVEVAELCALRTYPEVHHLVSRVRGRLRADVGPAGLIRAVFPGGSITGAPKRRAIEILDVLEPMPRDLFTGSLFWFGDDGTVESSILIRTIEILGSRAAIGAGGGVVYDSDPEEEWRESNAKARALTRALGFEPEEAR